MVEGVLSLHPYLAFRALRLQRLRLDPYRRFEIAYKANAENSWATSGHDWLLMCNPKA